MPSFEWDEERSAANKALHGIDFYHAQYAFLMHTVFLFATANTALKKNAGFASVK